MVRYIFVAFAFTLFVFASKAFANTANHYDNIGLDNYSLGANVWNGLERSDIYALTEGIPANSSSSLTNKLANHLLLTPSNLKSVKGDSASSNNLFSVRIKRLFERGDYNKANDLLKKIDRPFINIEIADLYLRSLFLSGQHGVACIEANIIAKHHKNSDAIKNHSAYCYLRFGDKADQAGDVGLDAIKDPIIRKALSDNSFSLEISSADEINKMPIMRLALLADMGMLDLSKFKTDSFRNVSRSTILPLLQSSRHSEKDRAELLVVATLYELISVEKLRSFYTSLFKADEVIEIKSGWEPYKRIAALTLLYPKASKDSERLDLVLQAIDLEKKWEGGSIPLFLSFDDSDVSNQLFSDNWHLIAPLIINYRFDLLSRFLKVRSSNLKTQYGDMSDESSKLEFFYKEALFLSLAYSQDAIPSSLGKRYVKYIIAEQRNGKTFNESSDLNIKILSALDKGSSFVDNRRSIYEKQKANSALQYANYKMPMATSWNEMSEAVANEETGFFVFLSLVFLEEVKMGEIYPQILHEIIQGYSNVGKQNMARLIAAKALIEPLE